MHNRFFLFAVLSILTGVLVFLFHNLHWFSFAFSAEYAGWVYPVAARLKDSFILYQSQQGILAIPPLSYFFLDFFSGGNSNWLSENTLIMLFRAGSILCLYWSLGLTLGYGIGFWSSVFAAFSIFSQAKTILYDAQTHFLVSLATLFLTHTLLAKNPKRLWAFSFFLGLILPLAVLTKQTAGGFFCLAVLLVGLLVVKSGKFPLIKWRHLLLAAVGSAVGLIFVFVLLRGRMDFSGMIEQVFGHSFQAKGAWGFQLRVVKALGIHAVIYLLLSGFVLFKSPWRYVPFALSFFLISHFDSWRYLESYSWSLYLATAFLGLVSFGQAGNDKYKEPSLLLLLLCTVFLGLQIFLNSNADPKAIYYFFAHSLQDFYIVAGLGCLLLLIGRSRKNLFDDQKLQVFLILFLVTGFSALGHHMSNAYMRLIMDTNIFVGYLAALVWWTLFSIHKRGLRLANVFVFSCVASGALIAPLLFYRNCDLSGDEFPGLKGAKICKEAQDELHFVLENTKDRGPEDVVQTLPEDPHYQAQMGGKRFPFSAAYFYADQYWPELKTKDSEDFLANLPKYLVLGPIQINEYLMSFVWDNNPSVRDLMKSWEPIIRSRFTEIGRYEHSHYLTKTSLLLVYRRNDPLN